MQFNWFFLIVMLGFVALIQPNTVYAQMAPQGAQAQQLPLIVIRFKDNSTDYQKQLHRAVRSALEVKQNIFFDILTVMPQSPYESQRKKVEQSSAVYTQQIISLMGEMGVVPQQMQIRSAFSPFVEAPEVQIFVR